MTQGDQQKLLESLSSELRRGVLILAVLSQLRRPEYGYSLKQQLADQGLDIPEGTLYPLMRRLETQGLLTSEWRVVDDTRPRRYYALSSTGKTLLADLTAEWLTLSGLLHEIITKKPGETA
jgi:DNA-binding PadR family transcriptional regulator